MKEEMEARIKELQAEFEEGKKMLEQLDVKREGLGQTILRISGAIQALEELMAGDTETGNEDISRASDN